jgi:hypothetical protein
MMLCLCNTCVKHTSDDQQQHPIYAHPQASTAAAVAAAALLRHVACRMSLQLPEANKPVTAALACAALMITCSS